MTSRAQKLKRLAYAPPILLWIICGGVTSFLEVYESFCKLLRILQVFATFYYRGVCLGLFLRPSVSVTRRHCVETDQLRMTRITPHNSPWSPILACQKYRQNSNGTGSPTPKGMIVLTLSIFACAILDLEKYRHGRLTVLK